jgi:hypothetical protein
MATNTEKRTGTEQYAAFMKRIVRSYGRKATAGELDTTALEQLVELREMLDDQIAETVHALRTSEGGAYSWSAIGDALGMTRAAAYKKFGGADTDARKAGGQPAELR